MGGSERQDRDVVGVLVAQGDALDIAYLDRWADDLGLSNDLARVRAAATTIAPPGGNDYSR